MKRYRRIPGIARFVLILALSGWIAPRLAAESPGADSVVAFLPGTGSGFGSDSLPEIVLGLPRGGGPLEGSLDVLSLGVGGEITLYFRDDIVVDGPGPDFTVFENPFFIGGDSLNRYIETGIVEVSQDGVEYSRFPFDMLPDIEPPGNPARFIGLAGVEPVLSNDGYPDPADPDVSGGDSFDLGLVGLSNAGYVRVIDTGNDTYDDDGDRVEDNGLDLPPQAGFDLDAVCRVNWTSRRSPFRVERARAISTSRLVVDFSKELEANQDIPPDYFELDGVPLTDADSVEVVSELSIEIVLDSPLSEGLPPPILDVRQWIRSASGENLLDPFERPVDMEVGIGRRRERERNGPVRISPPHPNPFVTSTTVSFEVEREEVGRIAVYDMRGRRICVLSDGSFGPGRYRLNWDGNDSNGLSCPAGIYLVHLKLGDSAYQQKVVYTR